MKHTLRFSSAAALACALSVLASRAWSHDAAAHAAGSNLFRAERGAAHDVHTARTARPHRYATPATRSPFDTPDTRPLRVSGDRLAPHAPGKRRGDTPWSANRVVPGADGLGRVVPEHARRSLDWDAYLRASGSQSSGRGAPPSAPTHPYDASRGVPGAPNPFDPSQPQAETRTFYDDGAGSQCTATGGGGGAARSSCNIRW